MYNYKVIDNTEFTYPDYNFNYYKTSSDTVDLHCMRGGGTGVQILLQGIKDSKLNTKININGIDNYEIYELFPIPVEINTFLDLTNALPNYPNRWAPFYVYDCLKPFHGELNVKNGTAGIYLYVAVQENETPRNIHGKITIDDINIPISLTVYSARYSGTLLKIRTDFKEESVIKYHNVKYNSNEFQKIEEKYLQMYRRAHQTVISALNCSVIETGENKYQFDFSKIDLLGKKAMNLGFQYISGPPIGGRKSWRSSTILVHGIPCMSKEGYFYLKQYLMAYVKFLKGNGWINKAYTELCGQPNKENAIEFRALSGLVHKIAPELAIVTPSIDYYDLYGSADVYIPMSSEYEKHKKEFETLRDDGSELWYYISNNPRFEGYINRYMDIPLLASRYLHWANYKYKFTGYLHWGGNSYQPNQDPEYWKDNPYAPNQNPFQQSCPVLRNADLTTLLPPGDADFVYPGIEEPYMSIRMESEREGIEDYELLKQIENVDKLASDGFCNRVFQSFKNVEYDPKIFKQNRIAMLKKASVLSI